MSVKVDVKRFTDKIEKFLKEAVSTRTIKPIAEELTNIIVKRTRLGYGVKNNFGKREKLRASGPGGGFKPSYLKKRLRGPLDSTTAPRKLNLTFTGQLLRSVSVIKAQDGKIIIGPTGTRNDGKDNQKIARYNADQGRIFLNVSELEFKQILRFYRREFTDLRRKLGLISRRNG